MGAMPVRFCIVSTYCIACTLVVGFFVAIVIVVVVVA